MGVVTVCSTVVASAPTYWLDTLTTGGEISGYWLMGRLIIARKPTMTNTSDITIAVMGRFMKVSAIISIYD
jgi:hypothetical protein